MLGRTVRDLPWKDLLRRSSPSSSAYFMTQHWSLPSGGPFLDALPKTFGGVIGIFHHFDAHNAVVSQLPRVTGELHDHDDGESYQRCHTVRWDLPRKGGREVTFE